MHLMQPSTNQSKLAFDTRWHHVVNGGGGGHLNWWGGGGDAVIETLWDIPVLMFPNKNCKLMDFLGNLGWLYFFI